MDAEWEKQFDDHRKRLKEITKLVVENCGEDDQMCSGFINKIREVVTESVTVRSEAVKLSTMMRNVISDIDRLEDFEKVKVNDMYEQEAQKNVPVPTFNYEQEFDTFVSNLKQDAEDSFIVSQRTESAAVDPWTKKPIEIRMTSKTCGHVYDKASITALKHKADGFRCPYIGCKVRITVNDLEEG